MTDLPYTYTDVDGDYLRIGKGAYTAYDPSSRKAVSVTTPTGEDAVRLAHAVLAAAGHTGHIVVSTEDSARAIRIRESVAAEDMRERAARVPAVIASSDPLAMRTVFEQIFALPLLDGDTDDRRPSLCGDAQSDLPPDQPATVHVATPEGITPCGEGHPDVTVSAFIPEVSCVECLRAIALEKGGQIIRYLTAWESARRGRTQQRDALRKARRARDRYRDERNTARAERAAARRYVRILEAQRAELRQELRAAEARLPEVDMVEVVDEVPGHDPTACTDVACLACRVDQMEQQYTDLANLTHGHSEDLARLHHRFTAQDDG